MDEKDKENYKHVTAIIKDKMVKKEVVNADRYLPSVVLQKVQKATGVGLSHPDHLCLYYIFDIRPVRGENKEPFDTNTQYCLYDEAHKSYVYQKEWVDFLIKLISDKKLQRSEWKNSYKQHKKRNLAEYL